MPPKGTKPAAKRAPSNTIKTAAAKKKARAPAKAPDDDSSPSSPSSPSDEDSTTASATAPPTTPGSLPPAATTVTSETITSETITETVAENSKRKKTAPVHLTNDQEAEMADWLKEHDFIYVKGRSDYKDGAKKKRLWEEKAAELNMEVKQIMTWYDSIRTKVGKIVQGKSGSAAKELSDRDRFLKTTFCFLADHIVRMPSRVAVGLRGKVAVTAPEPATKQPLLALPGITASQDSQDPSGSGAPVPLTQIDTDDDDDQGDIVVPTTPAVGRPPPYRKGKSRARPNTVDDDVLQNLLKQQQTNQDLQDRISGLLEPAQMSAPQIWGSWIGSMADRFHPSLLPSFYNQSFQLVMRFQEDNDNLQQGRNFIPVHPQTVVPIVVQASDTAAAADLQKQEFKVETC